MTKRVRASCPAARGAVALAALVLAFIAGYGARADVIELHGGGRSVEGDPVRIGPDGIELRVRRDGLETTPLTPWSEVRALRDARGGIPAGDAAAWLAAGNDLWRGRLRVSRGDWPFAVEPLARAYARWEGAAPSKDGLMAAAAYCEALVRAGRAADALRPAFEAIRLVRAGVQLDAGAGPRIADALARIIDAKASIPESLAPASFAAADAARASASLEGFGSHGDDALAAVVDAYRAAIDGAAPRVPQAKGAARLDPPAQIAVAALDALRAVRSTDAAERGASLGSLARARRSMPQWFEPWARFAAGRALAADEDATLRDRGRVLLASIVATESSVDPALAGRAEAELRQRSVPAVEGGTVAGSLPTTQQKADLATPREHSDRTAAWLERRGEANLLLAHLEAQLEQELEPATRAALVARLASILAARLEREDDEASRNALMSRAMALVKRNAEGAEPLRLAILRAQHRAAQRTAEDRRAGRGTDAECEAALAEFRSLVKELSQLAGIAERARAGANRDASAQVGTKAEELVAQASREEEIARNAQFFRAWAAYYAAWLGRELGQPDWQASADDSMRWFANLLEPGKAAVDPSEVSVDLRGNEGFASAILGSGLAASLAQTGATADAWLALLDSPRTNGAVRLKLPTWRMASYLDRGDLAAALAHLRGEGDGPQGVPMALVAAARAGRNPDAPGAAELLTEAVGRLAAAGRLRELAVIALSPGTAPSGAGARLFAAVRAASEANRLKESGDASGATAAWRRAAEELDGALSPDAPAAVAVGARSLRGYVLRGAGRPLEAGEAFAAASREMQGERAGDARWMAVLSFDEAAKLPGGGPAAARRDAEVASIVADLPESGAAVRARAWRVTRLDLPLMADIDALLGDSVPVELSPAARRAALEGLYRRFRATSGEDRRVAARRALAAGDDIAAGGGDEGTLELRRRIEMAIALDDRMRADESLAALESRVADAGAADALRDELRARRIQVAALDGRLDDARADLASLDPKGAWGRVAAASLLASVARNPSCGPEARAEIARAVAAGSETPGPLEVALWLRADAELLRAGKEPVDRAGAERASSAVLRASPGSTDVLLADADFRVAAGDDAGAARSIKALLSSVAPGSEPWFEAKAMQVEAAARSDATRARAMLEQVRQLGGGFGAGAASARLHALDAKLPAARRDTGGAQ